MTSNELARVILARAYSQSEIEYLADKYPEYWGAARAEALVLLDHCMPPAAPAPKTLVELREISLAADRVANEWSVRYQVVMTEDACEVLKQYHAACELSRLAFRAYVEHADYKPWLYGEAL